MWQSAQRLATLFLAASAALCGHAQQKPRRAKPPTFPSRVREAFFDDAREQLVGRRPASRADPSSSPENASAAEVAAGGEGERRRWSELVTGEALATEIKRTVNGLAASLTTPSRFRSGGNLECRRDFSVLAVLYGVVAEFDDQVRWQRDAPALRDALGQLAVNCKTASDQSYAAARRVKGELDDVLRGQAFGQGQTTAARITDDWSAVAERPLLMERMEIALNNRIADALSSERTFRRASTDVQQEAEILGLLSEIACRQQYDFWDDETYVELAIRVRDAAGELAAAAADANYEDARSAVVCAAQACAECHEGYR